MTDLVSELNGAKPFQLVAVVQLHSLLTISYKQHLIPDWCVTKLIHVHNGLPMTTVEQTLQRQLVSWLMAGRDAGDTTVFNDATFAVNSDGDIVATLAYDGAIPTANTTQATVGTLTYIDDDNEETLAGAVT